MHDRHAIRAGSPLLSAIAIVVSLSSHECGGEVITNDDEGRACDAVPLPVCRNGCTGNSADPICKDGQWICEAASLCDPPETCGPMPFDAGCVDCFGSPIGPRCKDGIWSCAVWSRCCKGEGPECASPCDAKMTSSRCIDGEWTCTRFCDACGGFMPKKLACGTDCYGYPNYPRCNEQHQWGCDSYCY